MDQIFQVGELVIMQNATYFEEHNGAPGVITEALSLRRPMNMITMEHEDIRGYWVRILVDNAPVVTARPWQLRKLRDDEQGLMSSKLNKCDEVLTTNRTLALSEGQPEANLINAAVAS